MGGSRPHSSGEGHHLAIRSIEAISHSPEDTQKIGRVLGTHAQPGQIFLLMGELGAGKTCLAQGLLWGLGADEYARSPTFVLVSQYQGRLTMHHIDLYRVNTNDVLDLGLEEYLYGKGVCVVEWADKASGLFPEHHLEIRIQQLGESTRRLVLSSCTPDYAGLLDSVSSTMGKG